MKTRYPILLLGSICMLVQPQARAAGGAWKVDAGGNWSDAANWSTDPTVPGSAAGDVINLTKAITANRTVTINATPRTAGILNIDSGTSTFTMVLARSNANYLIMDNNGSEAQINLGTSGSPQPQGSSLISAPIQMTAGGLVVTTYGTNVGISGGISSASSGTKVLRVATGSGVSYFRGVISDGNGVVEVLNDSTQGIYFNAANTFTGGVTVQQGTVRTNYDTGFGAGTVTIGTTLSGAGDIGIISRDTRTYANNIMVSSDATAATARIITTTNGSDITYTGAVEMQKALVLQPNAGTLTTFSGTISGDGDLTLENAVPSGGKTILSGVNTYKGETTVTRGITLLINGDNSAATGAVTATGVNAVLGGSGTIGGTVTIQASATLGVGGDGTGILTVADNVTINDTGSFSARINGATAGTSYDRLVVTGAGSEFSLTGINDLKLTLGYTPAVNALFFLVDMDDAGSAFTGIFDSLNGNAADLSQNALFTVGGQDFRISYTGDRVGNAFAGGNDLVIQAIPEPVTGLLLVGGLTAFGVLRRRRM